ncbi:MAG: hypothetical protein H0U84_07445 [Thermoleophilaceae bacterium]|nr:hypothetical protein [Thermoleophilaceae bacterium]
MMLGDRVGQGTRLECEECGAHAVLRDEDYRTLLAYGDGRLRCEVCGVYGPFGPAEKAAPLRDALALR